MLSPIRNAVKLNLGDPGRLCKKCGSDKESIAADDVSPPYVCPKCRTEWEQKHEKDAHLGPLTLEELSQIRSKTEKPSSAKRMDKTFENFRLCGKEDQRKNQEKILDMAQTFCCIWGTQKFNSTVAGLVLWGDHGLGKTHIAQAVANRLIKAKKITSLHVTAYKLYLEIKECFRHDSTKKESEIIEKYVKPQLLTIDEIDLGYGSDTEKRSFFNIFSERIDQEKQTLIISNKNWATTKGFIGPKSADRFKDGLVLGFIGEGYRGLKTTDKNKQPTLF